MTRNIEFIKDIRYIPEEYYPQAASSNLPSWYVDMKPYKTTKLKTTDGTTLKKCMPVFDSLTSGYFLKTFQDINCYIENGYRKYDWPDSEIRPLGFHEPYQFKGSPVKTRTMDKAPKFLNLFGIKTPSGYSCMFINPMNRENKIFKIFEGIVDTDTYMNPVHLPFMFLDNDWEGIIPAGTVIAQVIPFKRDSWEMRIHDEVSSPSLYKKYRTTTVKAFSTFSNGYKNLFWSKKKFK